MTVAIACCFVNKMLEAVSTSRLRSKRSGYGLTFAMEWTWFCVLSPFFLFISRFALIAMNTSCMVTTQTCQKPSCTFRIQNIACICVTIAPTTTTNRNVPNRIEILQTNKWNRWKSVSIDDHAAKTTYTSCYCWILSCNWHQMAKQIFRTIKAEANICGACPFLQYGRIEIIVCRWTII